MPKRSYGAVQQGAAKNRLRAYAACAECRRRKRKCDGKEPCSSCHGYGYTCVYHVASDSALSADDANGSIEGSSSSNVTHTTLGRAMAHDGLPPLYPSRPSRPSPSKPPPAQEPRSTEVFVSKQKGRYINAHSAVALPHLVGSCLGAEVPPRLHSFAWNLGTRPERKWAIHTPLSNFMTLADCQRLASVYFNAVHPMFPFLAEETFSQRLSSLWGSLESRPNFAAVVAAVAALGSFFANPSHPKEEALVDYAFSILDMGLSTPISLLDMDSVAGWILRTLYIRLTTRPAVACLASQTAMHAAEILSLHRDISERHTTTTSSREALFSKDELESRRRHYWVAWCLNCLLSVEYGLGSVKLSLATCSPPSSSPGVYIEHLVSLAQVLDSVETEVENCLNTQAMADCFLQLQSIASESALVCLFKAEVCVGILRRYVSAALRPSKTITKSSIAILEKALDSIDGLLSAHQFWWNLLSVPFQTVCIILQFDTDSYLTLLPTAMGVLRNLSQKLDTHLTKEALCTAQQLVALSRDNTQAKAKLKTDALGDCPYNTGINWPSMDEAFDFENWPLGLDFLYNSQ
ncbi:Protein RDR1 [Metarhizium anisopliae]|nr:Protein RDR1 [Metarhizium anisopliae]